jgi:predicted RNA binding protein YcfA (HicA-like mRNA interferase family)
MSRLPSLKPRRVLRALQRGGFLIHHSSGSHYILKHSNAPQRRVTLPFHYRDLKRGTLVSIVEQSGLTAERFLNLL